MSHNRINLRVLGHIAHVELNRAEKMNALDAEMFDAICEIETQLRSMSDLRAVVISGAGDNFCAGLDKSFFASVLSPTEQSSRTQNLSERTHGIANQVQWVAWLWRELPVPVIAALNGVVFGGGLQIALGADIRFASPSCQFSIMEMKWGIVPDMSSSQIMRHLIRDDVIRELTYTARVFSAEEALQYGFVTHLIDDPVEAALQTAELIAQQNPHAVRAAKRIIDGAYYKSQAEGLLHESQEQDQILGSPNQIEAVMAQLEKRAPKFKD